MATDLASTERPSMDATPNPQTGPSNVHKLSFNMCIGLVAFSLVLLIIGIAIGLDNGIVHGVLGILLGALGIAGLHTRHVWIMLAFVVFTVFFCICCLIDTILLLVYASKISRNGYIPHRYDVSVTGIWIYVILLALYVVYQGALAYYYFKARKEVVAEIYRDAFANLRGGGVVIVPAY